MKRTPPPRRRSMSPQSPSFIVAEGTAGALVISRHLLAQRRRDCALSAPACTLDTCADALKRRGAPSKPSRGCSVSPGAIFFPPLLHIKASGAVTSRRSRCDSDHHAQNPPPSTLPNRPGPRCGFRLASHRGGGGGGASACPPHPSESRESCPRQMCWRAVLSPS